MASAGQRNCLIQIQDCLERYSIDDVVWALIEYARDDAYEKPADQVDKMKMYATALSRTRGRMIRK